MAKYTIDWAFDCSCYGSTEIEAGSVEEAAQKARELHQSGSLTQDNWEARPWTGTENERVVMILDERMDCVDDGFDLNDESVGGNEAVEPARKINGVEITAKQFAWDGFHKIYLINSESERKRLVGYGYTLFPIDELESAYSSSCGLRFVHNADLKSSVVDQFEDAVFEGFSVDAT
jgi:hypothetical protein